MTTKWHIRISPEKGKDKVYGPYSQNRAESLAQKMNDHFRNGGKVAAAKAYPMWDPGITELRRQYQ